MGCEYQRENLKKWWELCFQGLHLESLLPWSPFTYHWGGVGHGKVTNWLIFTSQSMSHSFFLPPPPQAGFIISPSCQLDPIQKNPPSKYSQVNPGRESPWGSVWITGACRWGIILIMVVEVGRFFHYGWYHSLGKGISGEGAEHKPACLNPLLCSDCGCNVTSCFQLCHDACYVEF